MAVLIVNGTREEFDVDPSTPLLWVLREKLALTGTKFGCGISQCGACTVHVDGNPIRSCSTPFSAVEGKEVTTTPTIALFNNKFEKIKIFPGKQSKELLLRRIKDYVK